VASYGVHDGHDLWLRAMVADADGSNPRSGERRTRWGDADEAARVGHELGESLR